MTKNFLNHMLNLLLAQLRPSAVNKVQYILQIQLVYLPYSFKSAHSGWHLPSLHFSSRRHL